MAVKSSSNDLFLPYIYQNNDKLLNLFIYNWTTLRYVRIIYFKGN